MNYKRFLEERVVTFKEGYTKGQLYNLPEGYPAVVKGDGIVKGEVIEIDDQTLNGLDVLEGYYGEGRNNLYNRIEEYVQVGGDCILYWIYFYNRVDYPKGHGIAILNGDWREFIKRGVCNND